MKPFKPSLSALLVFVSLTAVVIAGPRSPGQRSAEEPLPSTPEGIEFSEAPIVECLSLARSGNIPEATSRLAKASAQSVGDQSIELRLGLAMLNLRTGQKSKALGTLQQFSKDGGTVGLRAKVLLRVATNPKTSGKNAGDLLSTEVWTKALSFASKDIGKEVQSEHQKLIAAIGREDWAGVGTHLANAQGLLREGREIKLNGMSDPLAKHMEGLSNAIRVFSNDFERGLTRLRELREQVRAFETNRRSRLPGGQAPNANAKIEFNQLVDRLHQAWQAAKPLDDEMERLQDESGGALRGKNKARLMPEGRIPPPLG